MGTIRELQNNKISVEYVRASINLSGLYDSIVNLLSNPSKNRRTFKKDIFHLTGFLHWSCQLSEAEILGFYSHYEHAPFGREDVEQSVSFVLAGPDKEHDRPYRYNRHYLIWRLNQFSDNAKKGDEKGVLDSNTPHPNCTPLLDSRTTGKDEGNYAIETKKGTVQQKGGKEL